MMSVDPEGILVRQLREIIRGLNSGRLNWDLVGDAYVMIEGEGLAVGELGDRLHDAYVAQSTQLVWRAITMTGWECWGDLARPLARYGDQAYLIDESTDKRLMLRVGLDFPGPRVADFSRARFPTEQLVCTFHWPRAFYTERVAAISGKDVRSLMFSVEWPQRLNALAEQARRDIGLHTSEFTMGHSCLVWRSSGNRVPVGPRPWENAMRGILDIYRDLPKITAFAAVLLENA